MDINSLLADQTAAPELPQREQPPPPPPHHRRLSNPEEKQQRQWNAAAASSSASTPTHTPHTTSQWPPPPPPSASSSTGSDHGATRSWTPREQERDREREREQRERERERERPKMAPPPPPPPDYRGYGVGEPSPMYQQPPPPVAERRYSSPRDYPDDGPNQANNSSNSQVFQLRPKSPPLPPRQSWSGSNSMHSSPYQQQQQQSSAQRQPQPAGPPSGLAREDPLPQRQFQSQFHTSFVSALQQQQPPHHHQIPPQLSPPMFLDSRPRGGDMRDRDRERERDREQRERMDRDRKEIERRRERDREQRERERANALPKPPPPRRFRDDDGRAGMFQTPPLTDPRMERERREREREWHAHQNRRILNEPPSYIPPPPPHHHGHPGPPPPPPPQHYEDFHQPPLPPPPHHMQPQHLPPHHPHHAPPLLGPPHHLHHGSTRHSRPEYTPLRMPLPPGQEAPIREIEWEPEREFKAKQSVNIGTYVWPKTPFPYFFPSITLPPSSQALKDGEGKENKPVPDDKKSSTPAPAPSDDVVDLETRTTILIPSGLIPSKESYSNRNARKRRRIWGGGLVPPPDRVLTLSSSNHPSSSKHGGSLGVPSKWRSRNHSRSSSRHTNGVPQPPPQRRRRIYTDDSDLFLCVLHSGFATWSGLATAREEKKDMRVDIRMVRVWGAKRTEDLFVPSSTIKEKDKDKKEEKKEEVITRFVGGIGERYFGGDKPPAPPPGAPTPAEVQQQQQQAIIKIPDSEEERQMLIDRESNPHHHHHHRSSSDDVPLDEHELSMLTESDSEDDGRGIESCSWGSGHDGSGIEIIAVEFLEPGSATRLFRQNRSQRLWEYAVQREHLHLLPPLKQVIGFKRRRDWESTPPTLSRVPNATALSTLLELDDEEEGERSLTFMRGVKEEQLEKGSVFSGGFIDRILRVHGDWGSNQLDDDEEEKSAKKRKTIRTRTNGKSLD